METKEAIKAIRLFYPSGQTNRQNGQLFLFKTDLKLFSNRLYFNIDGRGGISGEKIFPLLQKHFPSAMGQCEQEKGEYFSFLFPLPVQEDGKARGVEDDKCKKNDRSAFVSFPDARSLPAGDEPTKMEVLLSIG